VTDEAVFPVTPAPAVLNSLTGKETEDAPAFISENPATLSAIAQSLLTHSLRGAIRHNATKARDAIGHGLLTTKLSAIAFAG
jgi:hypothetical protein